MNPSTSTQLFTVYPAIDLRKGQVVRLRTGDPNQQTVYDRDPAAVARRFIQAGARWLHIINLDGALGNDQAANQEALRELIKVTKTAGVRTQVGGGLRSLDEVAKVLNMGFNRAILGTAAIKQPFVLAAAIDRWGPDRILVSLDAREGQAQVAGWTENTGRDALSLARWYYQMGLRHLVVTDVTRDGTGLGVDLPGAQAFSEATGLQVIAAGGVDNLDEVRQARQIGLAGIIVGRALYEGTIQPKDLFAVESEGAQR